ncbi:EamA family transporter [Palleronia sp. KMU-117]|uniref:EamA family transporter n=1 Tax=Palleronia sp. KMU-117 TaxID=3434108 RepID=UPI003D7183B6
MDAWIPITIAAAAAQTLRFMAQRHLKATGLSTSGATLARFVFSAPAVGLGILAYAAATGQALPATPPRFWGFALVGGLAQILATMCVVAIFAERNFAVGIAFKKTEVMLTALAGFLVLGDAVSPVGAAALGLGFVAVLLLSETPGATGRWPARITNRAAALGLASGVFFAISAVGYRGAVLALPAGDVALRAGVTMALVTAFQTLVMVGWMRWREPGQVTKVLAAWRIVALVGLLSVLGSYGWFAAFALQSAAYVFALGQVELIFSILASVLLFGERIGARETAGMALLALSVVVLVALA